MITTILAAQQILRGIMKAFGLTAAELLERAHQDLLAGARDGDLELILDAFGRGADVNFEDECGDDAMSLACENDHPHLIGSLVENGADVDKVYGEEKYTVLHQSANLGHEGFVQELINHGADVEAKDCSGARPIHDAIGQEHPQIVEMLVNVGVNFHAFSRRHGPAIVQCALVGNVETMRVLVEAGGADANYCWLDETILYHAISCNKTDMAHFLISEGADCTIGKSPLSFAALFGHLDLVRIMLEAGLNPDGEKNARLTPLVQAVENNSYKMVKLLLKYGADPNKAQDYFGSFPLYATVSPQYDNSSGNIEIAQLLLDHGAIVNTTNSKRLGETALHRAMRLGRLEFAQFLLLRGADVNIRDKKGRTAFPPTA